MNLKILILTAIIGIVQAYGKEPTQEEKIVKVLSKYSNPFVFRTYFQSFKTENDESEHSSSEVFQLHWKKANLYLTKNGTGKLYVLNNRNFERFDKTIYQGAYFGAIQFFAHDTLYSLGGYGFWNINGALRYFNNTTREWYIHPSNQHVPVAIGVNALAFYDTKVNILYVLYHYNGPEYVTEVQKMKPNSILIQALNLNTKKWWDSPKTLNPDIAEQLIQITDWTPTSNGIFIQTLKTLPLLLDFTSGKVYVVSESKLVEYIQRKSGLKNTIDFYSDEGIHFYDPSKDITTTVSLSKKDFLNSELQLINKETKNISTLAKEYAIELEFFLLVALITSLSFAIYHKIQLNKRRNDLRLSKQSDNYVDFINGLMPIEWDLLAMIFEKSNNQTKANAEEINKILGLESKPLRIQNNQRADVIFTLNEKFKAKLKRDDDLIIRDRMEDDKRLFEYSINDSVIEFLRKFFEKK